MFCEIIIKKSVLHFLFFVIYKKNCFTHMSNNAPSGVRGGSSPTIGTSLLSEKKRRTITTDDDEKKKKDEGKKPDASVLAMKHLGRVLLLRSTNRVLFDQTWNEIVQTALASGSHSSSLNKRKAAFKQLSDKHSVQSQRVPDDIWTKIFEFLPLRYFANLSPVCWQIRNVVSKGVAVEAILPMQAWISDDDIKEKEIYHGGLHCSLKWSMACSRLISPYMSNIRNLDISLEKVSTMNVTYLLEICAPKLIVLILTFVSGKRAFDKIDKDIADVLNLHGPKLKKLEFFQYTPNHGLHSDVHATPEQLASFVKPISTYFKALKWLLFEFMLCTASLELLSTLPELKQLDFIDWIPAERQDSGRGIWKNFKKMLYIRIRHLRWLDTEILTSELPNLEEIWISSLTCENCKVAQIMPRLKKFCVNQQLSNGSFELESLGKIAQSPNLVEMNYVGKGSCFGPSIPLTQEQFLELFSDVLDISPVETGEQDTKSGPDSVSTIQVDDDCKMTDSSLKFKEIVIHKVTLPSTITTTTDTPAVVFNLQEFGGDLNVLKLAEHVPNITHLMTQNFYCPQQILALFRFKSLKIFNYVGKQDLKLTEIKDDQYQDRALAERSGVQMTTLFWQTLASLPCIESIIMKRTNSIGFEEKHESTRLLKNPAFKSLKFQDCDTIGCTNLIQDWIVASDAHSKHPITLTFVDCRRSRYDTEPINLHPLVKNQIGSHQVTDKLTVILRNTTWGVPYVPPGTLSMQF